jgi:CubicO group peptidase (beta-lactamase class C family)
VANRRRGSILKGVGIALGVMVVIAGGAVFAKRAELVRLYNVITLFDEGKIVENFRNMDRAFEARPVRRSGPVFEFTRGEPIELPESFTWKEQTFETGPFLEMSGTSGLIVIKDDAIRYEQYYLGNDASTKWISWSMAKSITSALFGIAVAEGHIASIMDPVTEYVPELAGSGYDGVPIKHVLQMSSGIRFDETYGDFGSDINRMGRALALGTPLIEFISTLENEKPPGTYNHYVSMDTQVLGQVLINATGKSLAQLTEEKLWSKIGPESDAYWMLDGSGTELAFAGYNAVLRDYARFGRLYLNGGNWNGEQIVPADWVRDSLTPDAPHLMPGEDNPDSNWVLGYGYQWWIPIDPDGEFLALGVYVQMLYVYPKERLVIAKTSAYPRYNDDGDDVELATIELFRAIAAQLRDEDASEVPEEPEPAAAPESSEPEAA